MLLILSRILQLSSKSPNSPRFSTTTLTNDINSFQEVQLLSAIQTSLHFLPMVVGSISSNIAVGFLVKNTQASYLVAGSSVFSAVSPLLLAVINPEWPYWKGIFIGVFLAPMSTDSKAVLKSMQIQEIMFSSLSSTNMLQYFMYARISSSLRLSHSRSSHSPAVSLTLSLRSAIQLASPLDLW